MGFDQLMSIVPSLANQRNAKVSKATVLQKSELPNEFSIIPTLDNDIHSRIGCGDSSTVFRAQLNLLLQSVYRLKTIVRYNSLVKRVF